MRGSIEEPKMLLPQFIFSTKAKNYKRHRQPFKQFRDEFNEKSDTDDITREARCDVTEKGSTNGYTFEEWIKHIMSYYPDLKNEQGYRIILKVDGGPGRSKEIIEKYKEKGVIIFLGQPNCTAINQGIIQSSNSVQEFLAPQLICNPIRFLLLQNWIKCFFRSRLYIKRKG